jgi:hypothetical protein
LKNRALLLKLLEKNRSELNLEKNLDFFLYGKIAWRNANFIVIKNIGIDKKKSTLKKLLYKKIISFNLI